MAEAVGGRMKNDPKRIEFNAARKSFSGINPYDKSNNNSFKIGTLNPKINANYLSSSNDGNGNSFFKDVPSATKMNKKSDMSDQEFGLRITFRKIGAGLQNLGNTCFLNSVLQCLTYTEPLAAYLQSGKHQSSCNVAGFCALCAIQKHVSRALQSSGRILAPKDLVSNLRCISRNFRNSRQEDAHEYMVNLLESMHKCCLPSGVPSESPSAYEKSLVHKIFGGRLRSQVKCLQCSYCSNKYDPFIDLSLEIAKADSLHKALVHFTSAEQLDGGERQYQCQRCKQKVRALKQLTVYEAPDVLTIHLKRFRAHDPGQKIDRKVRFDPTLDLRPFVSGPSEGDLNYTLYGVLVHAGWSTRSGHYYCFVRTSTGLWYSLDDNRVVEVSERTVLEQKAYMLFYFRNRKIVASKKSSPVSGESKRVNALESRIPTSSLQGYEGVVQNGLKRKQPGVANPSVITSKDVCSSDLKLEYQSNEPSDMKIETLPVTIGITSVDKQVITGKDPMVVEDPKVVESLPASVLPAPSIGPKVVESLPPSLLLAPSIDEVPELENASLARCVEVSNELKSSSRFMSSSVAIPHDFNGQQNLNSIKPGADKISKMPTDSLNIGSLGIASQVSTGQTSDMLLPNNSTDVKSVAGVLQCEVTDVDSSVLELNNTHPESSILGAVLPPVSSVAHMPHRKSKKTVLMSSVSMRLGPRIMFSALSLQKKKKHRKNRPHSSKTRNLNLELMDDIGSGPSTSDMTRLTSLGSTPSRRKSCKFCPKEGSYSSPVKETREANSDDVLNAINGESTERVGQSDAMLATYKLSEKSCNINPDHSDFRVSEAFRENRSISVQESSVSVLTRGIEETSASRCNGIGLSLHQSIDSSNVGVVRIGYVADQWDKEYDREKRKKMRLTKQLFDRSHPFQEIATKRTEMKNKLLGRLRFGNRPFRMI